jgi:hypothetical protein
MIVVYYQCSRPMSSDQASSPKINPSKESTHELHNLLIDRHHARQEIKQLTHEIEGIKDKMKKS